jgi:SAM-dependent methyltransferase
VTRPDLDSVRDAYDVVAGSYDEILRDELAGKSLDRALLAVFQEEAAGHGGGPVGDLGCGPGRLTGHLIGLGLDVVGVDLSPRMIAIARQRHPGLAFAVGALDALPLADGALGGALLWYSIIHTPPDGLPAIATEVRRVVRASGPVLLAFQAAPTGTGGAVRRELTGAYGHDVELTAYAHDVDHVVEVLSAAGFRTSTRVLREPDEQERAHQAYLLARGSAARDVRD